MTIKELLALQDEAHRTPPMPGHQWPPSVYYRYIGLVARHLPAKTFVELGTCGGGCSRTVAMMNPSTKVISLDVTRHPQIAIMEAELPNFEFVFGDSIKLAKEIGPKQPVDLLFIDTIHTYDHTMNEFNAWRPYMAPGGVVCFDDLNRDGMDRFWNDVEGTKTAFNDLRTMHLSGSPTDGGFGALIV